MIAARPFDIQWQFSRHKCLPRKSKVGGANTFPEVSSQRKRPKRRQAKERERHEIYYSKGRFTINLTLRLFSHSLPLPFGRSIPLVFLSLLTRSCFPRWCRSSPLPHSLSGAKLFSLVPSSATLFLLFSRQRRAAPYYSSYVNEFRLIIWERSRTENDRNERVRGFSSLGRATSLSLHS